MTTDPEGLMTRKCNCYDWGMPDPRCPKHGHMWLDPPPVAPMAGERLSGEGTRPALLQNVQKTSPSPDGSDMSWLQFCKTKSISKIVQKPSDPCAGTS